MISRSYLNSFLITVHTIFPSPAWRQLLIEYFLCCFLCYALPNYKRFVNFLTVISSRSQASQDRGKRKISTDWGNESNKPFNIAQGKQATPIALRPFPIIFNQWWRRRRSRAIVAALPRQAHPCSAGTAARRRLRRRRSRVIVAALPRQAHPCSAGTATRRRLREEGAAS